MMQQCNERLQHNQCCRPDPMHKFTRIQHLKMPVETKWKPGPWGNSNTPNKIQNVTTFVSLSDARHLKQVHSKKTSKKQLIDLHWMFVDRTNLGSTGKWLFRTETRCSPRTRMLTRMLTVQMLKHMDMQSRRTLFCNSLLNSLLHISPGTSLQSGVESVECGVWSIK